MTINVALVGYGNASKQHIQAINSISNINIRGIFEQDESIEISHYNRYDSWQSVLNDKTIDLISFCIPPHNKVRMSMEAMLHGKSVMLEKPPCFNQKDLNSLLEVANKTSKSVGVMFQHRYLLPPKFSEINWGPETVGVLEVSRPRDPKRYFQSWRKDPDKSGGGILAHLGVHYLDLGCQLLGEPISIINGETRYYMPGLDMSASGIIKFASGANLIFAITGESNVSNERLIIFGRENSIEINNGICKIMNNDQEYYFNSFDKKLLRSMAYQDMVDSILSNKEPNICGLNKSIGIIKILENYLSSNEVIL